MNTQTIQIGKLFNILAAYEKLTFIPEIEQYINSDIKIQDENNNWINVNAAITKSTIGEQLMFSDGSVIKAAKKHLIRKNVDCVYLESLNVGDTITKANGEIITVISKADISDTLYYDLSVESATHLYQTSNGIVNHNTELSKLLAENLGMKLLRYDMSEYMEKHTVAKLLGAPPGYVGYDDGAMGGGKLINDIEKNPNAVILFDEIEKAHPDVSNILLSIMDEGMVTGSNGKKADCRNCIIVLTSNLGAAANEKNNIGFGRELQRSDEDDKAVKDFFKPEFRNRLDGIIKFNKLDDLSMRKIVSKFVIELNELMMDKMIKLRVTEKAVDFIVTQGFDSKMGARPVKRKIAELIKVPVSKKILFENIGINNLIIVDCINGALTFNVQPMVDGALPVVDENGFIILAPT